MGFWLGMVRLSVGGVMCVWGSNVGRRRGVRSRSRRDGDGQDWHMCLTCLVFIYVSYIALRLVRNAN